MAALVFGAGPTVGDVGACGRSATDLSEAAYAYARRNVDCSRCNACGLKTNHCVVACDPKAPSDIAFPPTCRPLVHDGEVCMRALRAASCSDYATYVDDDAPAVPTECDFCHVGFVDDSGATE
jgi:hypothetical protein